jgi:hypothetical protein
LWLRIEGRTSLEVSPTSLTLLTQRLLNVSGHVVTNSFLLCDTGFWYSSFLYFLNKGNLNIKIPYRREENWIIWLFDCFVLSLDLCSSGVFLFRLRRFHTLKLIRDSYGSESSGISRSRQKQETFPSRKLPEWFWGQDSLLSVWEVWSCIHKPNVLWLKTKFEHLQRHSTAWHHGCTESTMSSTSAVWRCTLPFSLLITNLSSANSTILTDVLSVLSFGDKISVDVQRTSGHTFLTTFRYHMALSNSIPRFLSIILISWCEKHFFLVIIEGLIRTTSSNVLTLPITATPVWRISH